VRAAGVPADAPGFRTLGYGEVLLMLEGRLEAANLAEAIDAATRRYAKRQETWFRHQLRGPVAWLDASREPGALADEVLSGYRAAER
jgi:tRNA dimethylallyltransferase